MARCSTFRCGQTNLDVFTNGSMEEETLVALLGDMQEDMQRDECLAIAKAALQNRQPSLFEACCDVRRGGRRGPGWCILQELAEKESQLFVALIGHAPCPLQLAVAAGNASLLKVLLDAGADINRKWRHKSAFSVACTGGAWGACTDVRGLVACIHELLRRGAVLPTSPFELASILKVILEAKNEDTLAAALQNGVDPNAGTCEVAVTYKKIKVRATTPLEFAMVEKTGWGFDQLFNAGGRAVHKEFEGGDFAEYHERAARLVVRPRLHRHTPLPLGVIDTVLLAYCADPFLLMSA